MKILVTGGSGFLGTHVVEQLAERGHTVAIYDTVKSRYLGDAFETILGDIRDFSTLDKAIRDKEIVYHLSGISGLDDCRNNPIKSIDINVNGTINVLESAKKHDISRILFASSAYVLSKYGSVYRTTKITCENLIRDYNELYQLAYTNMRFGSLYGRRADNRNSIHRFLTQAIYDKSITYTGTGNETREFIHVLDAAKIAANLLADEFKNRDVIITGNEKFKYDEIFEIINEILGENIPVTKLTSSDNCHYILTPYSYDKYIGKKITHPEFIDFGQGIIDCIDEILNRKD